MKTTKKITSLALAVAATLSATGPMTTTAGEGVVRKCMGVNACKGKSDSKTANSACAGQNACKGKGLVELGKETCGQAGGEFDAV
jgi:hypothetical protein